MRVAVTLVLLGLAVLADVQLTSCFKLASHDIKQFEAGNLGSSSSSLSSSSSNSDSRLHSGGKYESRSHGRIHIRHHKVPCICDRRGRRYRNGELPLCNYRRCFWPWDKTTTEKSQSSQRAQTTEQSLPTKKSPSWPWDKTTPDRPASTHGPKTTKRPRPTKKDLCDDKHGCWPWHKKTTPAPETTEESQSTEGQETTEEPEKQQKKRNLGNSSKLNYYLLK